MYNTVRHYFFFLSLMNTIYGNEYQLSINNDEQFKWMHFFHRTVYQNQWYVHRSYFFKKGGTTHSHQSRNNILHIYSKQILVQPQKEEM